MTKKKEKKLFIRYALFTDLFLSMVFFLTWSTIQMMGTFYLTFMNVTPAIKWFPVTAVVCYLIVRRLRISQELMLTLHLAVAVLLVVGGIFVFNGNISAIIHLSFGAVGNFVYSMSLRYKIRNSTLDRVEYDVLIISSVIHIIAFILLGIRHESGKLTEVTISIVLAAMFYFAARQLSVFENNYYHNLHSSTQPVGSIRRQNNLTILFVMAGILLSLAILQLVPVDKIVEILILGISTFMRWLLSLSPDADMPGETKGNGGLDEDMFPTGEATNNPILEFIMTAFATIIIVGVALAAFYSIIVWMRSLYRSFSHAEDHEVVTEDAAVTDIVESVKPMAFRLKRMDFGKGAERDVRKKFYLKMKKGISDGLPIYSSSSPRQIKAMLENKGDTTIGELTEKYEEIRYR